jgi:ATP-dependent exoDNAse (exonuclease V) beta subunit
MPASTETGSEFGKLAEEVEYAWAGETIKRVGSVVHRCIQWIARDGIENWDHDRITNLHGRYEAMFHQAGLTGKDLDWACNQVSLALSRLLNDPRGLWILSNVHAYPHNEFPLTGMLGDKLVNLIIDRTFIDAQGTCWIIDYKTSRHDGPDRESFLDQEQQRYAGQLNRYAQLMQQLENRPIKLGLYFPLLQGWREWEYKL